MQLIINSLVSESLRALSLKAGSDASKSAQGLISSAPRSFASSGKGTRGTDGCGRAKCESRARTRFPPAESPPRMIDEGERWRCVRQCVSIAAAWMNWRGNRAVGGEVVGENKDGRDVVGGENSSERFVEGVQVGECVWFGGDNVAAAVEVEDYFFGRAGTEPVRVGAVGEDFGGGCEGVGGAVGSVG